MAQVGDTSEALSQHTRGWRRLLIGLGIDVELRPSAPRVTRTIGDVVLPARTTPRRPRHRGGERIILALHKKPYGVTDRVAITASAARSSRHGAQRYIGVSGGSSPRLIGILRHPQKHRVMAVHVCPNGGAPLDGAAVSSFALRPRKEIA